jgi:uncharacterized membrane protein YdjX (TVP38/TMEM64 family)
MNALPKPTGNRPQEAPRRSVWPMLLLGCVGAAGLFALGRNVGAYVPRFADEVARLGVWGPLVFIAGYAAAAVAFVPGSLLTLAAGAIFGLGRGIVIVFVAAVIGSSIAFWLARTVLRQRIERRVAASARFTAIDRAIGLEGRRIVLLLRLSPAFPFSLLNYGLGLTRVRFVDYLFASIGMLPGTVLYVYYGKVAGDVAALAGGATHTKGAADWALLTLGLLATIAVTRVVTRIARRALRDATGD